MTTNVLVFRVSHSIVVTGVVTSVVTVCVNLFHEEYRIIDCSHTYIILSRMDFVNH